MIRIPTFEINKHNIIYIYNYIYIYIYFSQNWEFNYLLIIWLHLMYFQFLIIF